MRNVNDYGVMGSDREIFLRPLSDFRMTRVLTVRENDRLSILIVPSDPSVLSVKF